MPPDTDAGAADGGAPTDAPGKSETDSGEATGNVDGLKKALERERKARRDAESRAKALEPFEKQAKDLDEASKSEVQKLNDALTEANAKHGNAEMELLRFRTAAEKGVPLNLVRFLSGSTAEEVAESADLLLKELGTKPTVPGKPREQQRLSTGKPSDHEGTDDPMELIKLARSNRV